MKLIMENFKKSMKEAYPGYDRAEDLEYMMKNMKGKIPPVGKGFELDKNKDGKLSPDALDRIADELDGGEHDEDMSPEEMLRQLENELANTTDPSRAEEIEYEIEEIEREMDMRESQTSLRNNSMKTIMENFDNSMREGFTLDQDGDGELSADALRRQADELRKQRRAKGIPHKSVRSGNIYLDKDGIYKDKDLEMTFGEKLRKKMGMQSETDKKREAMRARLASPAGQADEAEWDEIDKAQEELAAYQAAHGGRTPGQVQDEYEQWKKDQAAYEREKERKRRRQREKDRYLDSQPKPDSYVNRDGKLVYTNVSRHGGGI